MRFTLMVSLVISICAAWPTLGADKPLVVEVWPGTAPDESGDIGEEKVRMSPKLDRKQVEVTEPTRLVTNVTKPTLTIYRPAKEKDTGTAVLICPGGGYWDLYWQLEGEEVAVWLNSIGATGIILKYRVPRRPDEVKGEPARRPLQDAQRAVSLVRSKASQWGINRSKSASWVSRPAAIWQLRRRQASTGEPTSPSMTWTQSVAGLISPLESIRAT